jgi:hypothetical protein
MLQSLFGRMMNTLEELDTAADAFSKHYLFGGRGVPAPAGSPTPSDTEFALLDAAYGSTGSDANRARGSQQVAAMNRALDAVQEAEMRGGGAAAEKTACCDMGGPPKRKSSASWFTQFRCDDELLCGLLCVYMYAVICSTSRDAWVVRSPGMYASRADCSCITQLHHAALLISAVCALRAYHFACVLTFNMLSARGCSFSGALVAPRRVLLWLKLLSGTRTFTHASPCLQ